MSVYDIDINTYEQDFTITEGNKEINGKFIQVLKL